MKVIVSDFGTTEEGEAVFSYTLKNRNGMEVTLLNYGAIIQKLLFPDRKGRLTDVALGHDELIGYFNNDMALGSFVGRNANRIKGAKTVISGKVYELDKNDGENNLHSGFKRSSYMVFEAEVSEEEESASVRFSRLFPDGEQGFPGNADISVKYTLNEVNELILSYHAVADEDTVINPTNHSYFNLNGEGSGNILLHKLLLHSDKFTPTDDSLIPTGEEKDVTDTPMDFRTEKTVGRDIDADYLPLRQGRGYDHHFVLASKRGEPTEAAVLTGDLTGIKMEVLTDLPGLQVYTGNFLDGVEGKGTSVYRERDGICFETQFAPNACNEAAFQTSILKAGEEYSSHTVFRFSN